MKFSLHSFVESKYWNEKKSEFRPGFKGWDKLNNLVRYFESECLSLRVEFDRKGKRLLKSDIEHIFTGEKANTTDFHQFVRNICELEKNKLSPATVRGYNAEISKLKEFSPVLTFDMINTLFLKRYEKNLAEKHLNAPITIHKSLRFIKAICSRAVSNDILSENPFKKYPIGRAPTGHMKFLSIQEVRSLESLYVSPIPAMEREILRYFLFSCFTGMRFTDLKTLSMADIITNDSGVFVYKEMQKTGKITLIPLSERAKRLIINYEKKPGRIFRVYCSQYTNRTLKELMKMAKINVLISVHCGRHTFATIAAQLGFSPFEVQRILGHQDIRTTQIYTKVTDQALIDKMKLFDQVGA